MTSCCNFGAGSWVVVRSLRGSDRNRVAWASMAWGCIKLKCSRMSFTGYVFPVTEHLEDLIFCGENYEAIKPIIRSWMNKGEVRSPRRRRPDLCSTARPRLTESRILDSQARSKARRLCCGTFETTVSALGQILEDSRAERRKVGKKDEAQR